MDDLSQFLDGLRLKMARVPFSETACLHDDVVLGQEEGGYLAQLPHGPAVGIRDHGSQVVQGFVEVVHPTPFPEVNRQSGTRLGCHRRSDLNGLEYLEE